ncbi:NAD(P)-dependent oxidoreductase [Limibaculum sp. FT325]|uniref:NAD(P)-dependent oxidoreductase n=1 Tax=Thermohalobaculum sediminis TaxID=2939436 RepID=UPI0020C134CB|nr:NAD(P)-dependent oxidoreductase [Limibaculum sediminis]MCL5777788.1 NAD(P)-dependent oxidoreductase [Limibaculum sediminis]
MDGAAHRPGIAAGRLGAAEIAENFGDLHPPLDPHEAAVAADRCYFCHDAPCIAACPTGIDIPLFIRQIATGQPRAAAQTIFEANILGGMCARVCPTETLCEEACVRMTAEERPVEIGRLQRYATDAQMATGRHPFTRAAPTGRRVAVVGAGPAGLACAHRLAMHGHDVVVMDARPKGGGLNEYGIAAYKTVDGFAQAELDWLMAIGGIELRAGVALGRDVTLDGLAGEYDAVFLGMGLGAVNALACEGNDLPGVEDAVDFIARLRQSGDLTALPVGRRVVVIGGGMTAVDAAVQSKLLGAEEVTIVYRRGKPAMSASLYEQDLAASKGVRLIYNARPLHVLGNGRAEAVEFEYTADGPSGLHGTGETFTLAADQVFRAIGQTLVTGPLAGLDLDGRKITVDAAGRTSRRGVWAGGDCASGGADLTVTAVAQGRDAAESIHRALMG